MTDRTSRSLFASFSNWVRERIIVAAFDTDSAPAAFADIVRAWRAHAGDGRKLLELDVHLNNIANRLDGIALAIREAIADGPDPEPPA